jgi:hypothetical protein
MVDHLHWLPAFRTTPEAASKILQRAILYAISSLSTLQSIFHIEKTLLFHFATNIPVYFRYNRARFMAH